MTERKDKVERLFNEALRRYALIADGDRILVGLSGGKDSMALLELLARRRRIFVPRFEVHAAYVRMTDIDYSCDETYLTDFASSLDIHLHILETTLLPAREILSTNTQHPSSDAQQSPCFRCSWQRRKQLFAIAKELNCNKIALGHHRDDLIATALMNLTFQGQFSTMRPQMPMDRFPMTLIRPLCLVREAELARWAADHHYRQLLKRCPYDDVSRRRDLAAIAQRLEQLNPEFPYTFFHALEQTF